MPLFVFRRYKKEEGGESTKAKHPKLIVDEQNQDYGFMGLTKSPKRGNHNNIKIDNPQKNNTEDSYIRKELRYDNKKYFGEILTDYVLSEKDIEKILEFLEDKKRSSLLAVVSSNALIPQVYFLKSILKQISVLVKQLNNKKFNINHETIKIIARQIKKKVPVSEGI